MHPYHVMHLMIYSDNISQRMKSQTNGDYYLTWLRVNGCYFWFNVLQIILTLLLLVALYCQWLLAVTRIEVMVTFFIVIDLIMRYFTQNPATFCRDWDNRINFLIVLLLLVGIIVDMAAPLVTHRGNEVYAGIFISLRYIVQFSRLCRLFIHSRQVLQVTNHPNVSFAHLEQPSYEEVESSIAM